MTKPANFPARQNERRGSALARIEDALARGTKSTNLGVVPLDAGDRKRLQGEGDALALRLRSPDELLRIRTKKTKADGWSAERTYRQRGKL